MKYPKILITVEKPNVAMSTFLNEPTCQPFPFDKVRIPGKNTYSQKGLFEKITNSIVIRQI